MRHPLTIAGFVLLVALVSASAQRGGMRGGAGGHGVSAGHSSGGHSFGGSRAFGGMHAGSGSHPFSSSRASFRGNGFRGRHVRGEGFRHCFGCRRRFGFAGFGGYGYGGYYDPYWWWDSSSSYDDDQDRELTLASEMDALSIEEQRLREQEERDGDQDSYIRRPQPRAEEKSDAGPETALVFRDQHVEEIRNYAISGGTLWVLNDHQAGKKIPLTQLDLAATAKMNDERGVDFQVPQPSLSLRIMR